MLNKAYVDSALHVFLVLCVIVICCTLTSHCSMSCGHRGHQVYNVLFMIIIALVVHADVCTAVLLSVAYCLLQIKCLDKEMRALIHLKTATREHSSTKQTGCTEQIEHVDNEHENMQTGNQESKSFTSPDQFKDAQSDVYNENAIDTEIRLWSDGYGTQGAGSRSRFANATESN